MRYNTVRPAVFLSRPNRFIAYADLTGSTVTCHVKNTGRCRELLLPGTTNFLEDHSEASLTTRKTRYSVIAVLKERKNQPPLRRRGIDRDDQDNRFPRLNHVAHQPDGRPVGADEAADPVFQLLNPFAGFGADGDRTLWQFNCPGHILLIERNQIGD